MSSVPPILLGDARVAAIPIAPTSEPLVRLDDGARLSVARSGPVAPVGAPVPATGKAHTMVRRALAERLGTAFERLPDGLRLHVVEGYRPPNLQRRWFEAYQAALMARMPGLDGVRCHELASRFIAPPNVAAHPSGAAVDVTLVDAAGNQLDMGTLIDATPEESNGACYFDAPGIAPQARENREILAASLRSVGFVNYPTEWWHWSYGDRYWAVATGRSAALYGPVGVEQGMETDPPSR